MLHMINLPRLQKILKVAVFAGLLVLIGIIFSQKIDLTAVDLGRHLANGRAVWSNPDILSHNAYSYTEPGFAFINHHWLYGVIVYAIYRLSGFIGLSVMNIAVILAAFLLAFRLASRKISSAGTDMSGRPEVAGFFFASLISIPVILLLSERVEIRPEIFSCLFVILTYLILNRYDGKEDRRRLWLIVPLLAVWANVHIYFAIGLAFVGFKAVADFLAGFLDKRHGVEMFFHRSRLKSAWKKSWRMFMVLGTSALACLLNPNTWRGLIYPFDIFTNYGYDIAENKSVFFLEHLTLNGNYFLFKLLAAILAASWILYLADLKRGREWKETIRLLCAERSFDLFASLFITVLAFAYSRNISLFGLFSLVVISVNMGPVLVGLKRRNESRLGIWKRFVAPPFPRIHVVVLCILLALVATACIYVVVDNRGAHRFIQRPFGWGTYADNEGSADFFKEKGLRGPIFNNYDIGSALIFWLYGREKVFVDNRPEAYPASFFNEIYRPMEADTAKWKEYAAKYDIRTIYISHADGTPWAQQFLRRILKDKDWRLVYFDAYTVILIDPGKYSAMELKNLAAIDIWSFKDRMRELISGAGQEKKIRLGNLAEAAGFPELAEEAYREVLSDNASQAQALISMADLYASYGDKDSLNISLGYSQRALDAGLRLPGVYNQRALAYWRLGQYEKAESSWRSALKCERKNVSAVYYLNQIEELRRSGELPAN